MRRRAVGLLAVAGWLLVSGIASAGVKSKRAPGVDLSHVATYRWKAESGPVAPDLDRLIRASAEQQLAKQGLKKASADGAADLVLSYNAGLNDQLVLGTDIIAGWFGDLIMVGGDDSNVSAGMLFTFEDAASGELVWGGWIRMRGTNENAPQVMRKKAPKAAAKILAAFPD